MNLHLLHVWIMVGSLMFPAGRPYSMPQLHKAIFYASKLENVPYGLMVGIAENESRLDPQARRLNANGTHDWGLFQINTVWRKKLGVARKQLLSPFANALAAAYIFRHYKQRYGSWWAAVQSYHAGHLGEPWGIAYAKDVWAYRDHSYELYP